jgi:hypothetical protein
VDPFVGDRFKVKKPSGKKAGKQGSSMNLSGNLEFRGFWLEAWGQGFLRDGG